VFNDDDRRGMALDSMVSGGCIVSGATVKESLLFTNVRVDSGSYIEKTLLFPDVRIGNNCIVKNAIIDTACVVPDGMQIGVDRAVDARHFYITEKGVVLVTREMLAKIRP
jgi:glucose-1-phosphate adenylyltransferase